MINRRWKNIVTDVESRTPSISTDHKIVIAKLRLKFKKETKPSNKNRKIVPKQELNQQTRQEIEDAYEKISQAHSTEDAWKSVKHIAELSTNKIKPEKFTFVDEYMKDHQTNSTAAMNKLWENKTTEIETAANENSTRKFYQMIKEEHWC